VKYYAKHKKEINKRRRKRYWEGGREKLLNNSSRWRKETKAGQLSYARHYFGLRKHEVPMWLLEWYVRFRQLKQEIKRELE